MEEIGVQNRPTLVTVLTTALSEVALCDEERLLIEATAGETVAFTRLLRSHDAQMRGVAWRLLGSQAAMDDALQDAYLKAWRNLASFRREAAFGTWLYAIVRSTCLDHLRASGRRATTSLDRLVDPVASNDPAAEVATSLMLREAMAQLPADQLCVVALVDGEGHSYESVAQLLDVKPGTVASRLHRGRAALRTLLSDGTGEALWN